MESGVKLHPDETSRIECGRFAEDRSLAEDKFLNEVEVV